MASSNAFNKKDYNNPYNKPLRGGVGNINAPTDIGSHNFSEEVIADYAQGSDGSYFHSTPKIARRFSGVSDFQENTIVDAVDRRTARMPDQARALWNEIERFVPKTMSPANVKRVNLFMSKSANWDMANQLAAIRALDRPLTRDEQIRRHTLEQKMSMAKTHLTRELRAD
jgi:hypothetical protein